MKINEEQLSKLIKESLYKTLLEYKSDSNEPYFIYDHNSEFAKTIFGALKAIENELHKYSEKTDKEWDDVKDTINSGLLRKAHVALTNLINSNTNDYKIF